MYIFIIYARSTIQFWGINILHYSPWLAFYKLTFISIQRFEHGLTSPTKFQVSPFKIDNVKNVLAFTFASVTTRIEKKSDLDQCIGAWQLWAQCKNGSYAILFVSSRFFRITLYAILSGCWLLCIIITVICLLALPDLVSNKIVWKQDPESVECCYYSAPCTL